MIAAAWVMILFAACKPTEANYKKAYDAAKAKREAAVREQMLPAQGMQSDDGPQLRVVDGDSIYVSWEILRTASGKLAPAPWVMAVGVYKMSTNAEANAEALRGEGYGQAVAMKNPDGLWYAIADASWQLDSLRQKARAFRAAHPGYPYVGLPRSPILIQAH